MNKIVKIIFKCIEVFEQKKNNKKLQVKCDSRNTNKKKMETFRNQLNTVKNALEKIACFAHESNRNVKSYEIHWF